MLNVIVFVAALALASTVVGLGIASASMLFDASDLVAARGITPPKYYKGIAYLTLMASFALAGIVLLLALTGILLSLGLQAFRAERPSSPTRPGNWQTTWSRNPSSRST